MLRTGLAAVLLVVFLPALVLANTSTWATRTVLDSRSFAATAERTLESPALEAALAASLADALVDSMAERAPTDLVDLAVQALHLDATATRAEVSTALADRIRGVLGESTVRALRLEVIASIHGYLMGTLEGTPGLVTVRGGDVLLDPSHLLDRVAGLVDPAVAARIDAAGLDHVPPVVVAQVAALRPVQRAIDILHVLQVIVPLVAIAVALLIVVIAHRRERALGIVGVAVALAGLASLAIIWGAGLYVTHIPGSATARTITEQVYDAFLAVLRDQAILLVVVGASIFVVARLAARRARRRAVVRMLGPRETGPGPGA